MANYGLSETGFAIKRLADIRESMKQRLLAIKDPDTGESLQINFDEDDPFIQVINAFCDELATLWQMQNVVYQQFNPNTASGASLSSLVQLNGLVRQEGLPSTVTLKFTGAPGVLIAQGTKVTDASNQVIWATTAPVTVLASGECEVTATSETNGVFTYAAGTINTILSDIVNVYSVVNPADTIPGAVDETDESLRLRRSRSTETPSQGIAEAIYGSISNLPGVDYVKVFTNRDMTTDARGIEAKSIAVVVRGGVDQDIAKQIFIRSSLGENFTGSTSVSFTDSLQQTTIVKFSRPIEIAIDVAVVVGEIEGTTFPDDYLDRIKNNILAFAINGVRGLGIDTVNSFDDYGFPPSEDIVASRLYTPINAIPGIKIVSLKIAKHGQTLGTDDIPINWNQVGTFSASNITVTKQ